MSTAIFWPIIAQATLTYAIYYILGKRRFGAVREGTAKPSDYSIPHQDPAASATAARSLINQFELPMLFYVVALCLHLTNGVNYIVLLLAWAFVISRGIHATVHVTSNRLMLRQRLFMVGFFLNAALWIWLVVHLIGG